MSGEVRGPSGAAPPPPPPPPAGLNAARLPRTVLPAGRVLHRIHRSHLEPVLYGPGASRPPTSRFHSATGRFGVLYVSDTLSGAFTETILRNPQRRMVSMSEIASRSETKLACRRDLRLVALHGEGLQRLGTDNSLSTGPYGPCGLWADALWDHPEQPDGVAYRSRHDPARLCFAIFERGPIRFAVSGTRPLTAMLKDVAAILDRYGKSIAPEG